MNRGTLFPVAEECLRNTRCREKQYFEMYARSIEDPEGFWSALARKKLHWTKPFEKVGCVSFGPEDVSISWFRDGKTNVCYNCVDRHVPTRAHQAAILWEGDTPGEERRITYQELHELVCRFAVALHSRGVRKGDRVVIYMPMIPEVVVSMLACARIGAIHAVVFGGFSAQSLAGRIQDSEACCVVTSDEGFRGGKIVPFKKNVEEALTSCPNVGSVFVVRRTGGAVPWVSGRDVWWDQAIAEAPGKQLEFAEMNAEDPLFILYTSGSTGKPKGVLHTTAGYLLYAAVTHEYVFDMQEGEVYWCTADVGWITGHTYVVYGPLANGSTILLYEGVPSYPSPSRVWEICDKYRVGIFYTAPTAIRALMREGDGFVRKTSRASLRILGSVGEPLNPEAWRWYYEVVGERRCPVVDTWWQTETGGILITPLPCATPLKPGSVGRPFFGIRPAIVDDQGTILEGAASGNLCLLDSWPGQMRTVYKNHARFVETYFKTFPGKYMTGDGCRRDEDGYYWITGRVDDVLNVSGHRLGTAEIESALVAHPQVAEAAAVGFPHSLKGQGIHAYVTLCKGVREQDSLALELIDCVRRTIGAIAKPDCIQWAPGLPKTRSGKIMRRILRSIAAGEFHRLGDVSTLADPDVISHLIEGFKALGRDGSA